MTSCSAHALVFENISKTYRCNSESVNVLENINLAIQNGESVILCGESGIGKTTLLYMAGLLEQPSSGMVTIAGKPCDNDRSATLIRRHDIGFIYQFHHLLPEFDVLQNVAMPLLIQNKKKSYAEGRALSILNEIGIGRVSRNRVNEISGGQRQRVAIARAVIHNPKIIIADEPTGNLDQDNANKIFDMLLSLSRDRGISLLIATHNMSFASSVDSVITIKNRTLHKL